MNNTKLSFYTLIAYDYKYSISSILSYYDIADEIILAYDKDFKTWTGNSFTIDQSFFDYIKKIDVDNKIKFYSDSFYLSKNNPLWNDSNERNRISIQCKPENYIIGIDSDEIVLNANEFKKWFGALIDLKNSSMTSSIKTVFKTFGKDVLIIEPTETTNVGTSFRVQYRKSRNLNQGLRNVKVINSPMKILHYSWGRTLEEIKQKLNNWGHNKDFNLEKYINFWQSVNLENFLSFKNFHPLRIKHCWASLRLIDLKQYDLKEEILKEIERWEIV